MIEVLAFVVVVLAGLYLIALAAVSLTIPTHANRFLLGFAGTPLKHYSELFLRFVVGGAFVLQAPRMLVPSAFSLFGWVLIVTTACLLFIPWRWHHRFAQQAVSRAIRYITLIGLVSFVLGGLILAAVMRGSAA